MSKEVAGKNRGGDESVDGHGLATAKRFAKEGMDHVFITGRRQDTLDAAVAEIGKYAAVAPISKLEGDKKMKKWRVIIPVVVIALIAAWYAFRPERLFVNRKVDESFPTVKAVSAGSSRQALESGNFYSIMHPTNGTATIYRLADGSRVLRLTNFKTSNGPDVHIYMVAADDAKDNATVKRAGFIDLGDIKGNIGDQNYALGPDVDLAKYRAVSVWCKRFSVNFGAAPLMLN